MALFAVWTLLPVATIAAVTVNLASSAVTGPTEAVFAPVRAASSVASEPVDIVLGWGEGSSINSPGWNGLVQRVYINIGSDVADGAAVAQINGVLRVFALTEEPFYRTLTIGDTGRDVAELNAFLVRRGLPATTGPRYTFDTERGVSAFAKTIGAPDNYEFDPSWVVWASVKSGTTVGDVSFTPGQIATPNVSIAETSPVLDWAQTVQPSSVTLASADSTKPPIRPDASILITAEESQTLMIGDMTIALVEDRDEVAPEGLLALQSLFTTRSSIAQGNLLRDVSDAVAVPTASLITDGSLTCVLVRGTKNSSRAVQVAVVADVIGQTFVTGKLKIGASVEVSAPSTRRSCRS